MNIFIICLKTYFLKNDFRGSVILFWKIGFRGNVHLAKCTFWQVSILENSFLAKCPFGQMYIHSGKCPFWKIAFRGNVHSAKCTFWQVSIPENSFSGKCPFGQMYILESVRSGKCFLESVFQGNVFRGYVRIPTNIL